MNSYWKYIIACTGSHPSLTHFAYPSSIRPWKILKRAEKSWGLKLVKPTIGSRADGKFSRFWNRHFFKPRYTLKPANGSDPVASLCERLWHGLPTCHGPTSILYMPADAGFILKEVSLFIMLCKKVWNKMSSTGKKNPPCRSLSPEGPSMKYSKSLINFFLAAVSNNVLHCPFPQEDMKEKTSRLLL